ncbi:hypothetical protein [Verrucomicrobium spinosum]|uniref:hypothetical protein n=2 Tax=Verrucomicrobium spinosum TaxID=2736 RepID=UPI0001744BFE|nr:hypothetical protein [Verrucomicrobium spinosum]
MKPGKLITIRTVIGQEVPDVDHLPGEIVIAMSPEHLTMFRGLARKAGKSFEDYFRQDMLRLPAKPVGPDAPVPYEIVAAPAFPPAPASEQFLMEAVAELHPAKTRKKEAERIHKACAAAGVPFAAILKTAVNRVVGEIEATGSLDLTGYLPPVLFPKLHARLAEINRVFELRRENGFTQWIMEEIMGDLLNGEDGLLFDAYNFDDTQKARRDYRAMVGRWRKEDGLPPLKLPPWRVKRVEKTERRAA